MNVYQATESDSEELKAFFSAQVVEGLFHYQVHRPNSFFDQYRLTSDDFITLVLKDDEGQIQAMVSLVFRKGYVNDQEQTLGYVTDLRVSNSREASLKWMSHFIPLLQKQREERNCHFVFSDLEQYESKAYNTLLRRRHREMAMPRYHLFRKFFLTTIYGKTFFAEPPLDSIKIDFGKTEDVEAICQYLREKSVRRPLRFNLPPEELERRCLEWPNFSIQNFLVARNWRGKIIGCMAPWNNRDVQKVSVKKYHDASFRIYSTSRTLSAFRLTRPLPRPGDAFNVKHITHGAYDNPDIFYSLLTKAYDECKNRELLVYPNYYGEFTTRPPSSFVHVKIPYGFYSVIDDEMKLPQFLHPNPFEKSPDFQYSYF